MNEESDAVAAFLLQQKADVTGLKLNHKNSPNPSDISVYRGPRFVVSSRMGYRVRARPSSKLLAT